MRAPFATVVLLISVVLVLACEDGTPTAPASGGSALLDVVRELRGEPPDVNGDGRVCVKVAPSGQRVTVDNSLPPDPEGPDNTGTCPSGFDPVVILQK